MSALLAEAITFDTCVKLSVCLSVLTNLTRVAHPARLSCVHACLHSCHSLGADGVMVPIVNSRADAEQAVGYCLYPPQGERSVAGDTG